MSPRLDLRRHSASAIVVLLLGAAATALGIVVTWADVVFVQPLPVAMPASLAVVGPGTLRDPTRPRSISQEELDTLVGASFDVAAIGPQAVLSGDFERVTRVQVSPSFFRVLRVSPFIGRAFQEADAYDRDRPAVVIGYDLWVSKYGKSPTVLGQNVSMEDGNGVVVGVMPREFRFPRGASMWLPLSPGQLKGHIAFLEALVRFPTPPPRVLVVGGQEWRVSPVTRYFRPTNAGAVAYLIAFSMLLLIVVMSEALNLQFVAQLSRLRETGIKLALGVSPRRLIGDGIMEGLGIATAAIFCTSAALPVGITAVRMVLPPTFAVARQPVATPIIWGIVITFATLSAVTVCVLPALVSLRTDMWGALHGRVRSTAAARVRSAAVFSQVAVALACAYLALMTGRSLAALLNVDLGFRAPGLWALRLPPATTEGELVRRRKLFEDLQRILSADPRVKSVAGAMARPLESFRMAVTIANERRHRPLDAVAHYVTPEFFDTIRLPLTAGRTFAAPGHLDRIEVVVSHFAASELQTSVGENVRISGIPARVVGISSDARINDVVVTPAPTVYLSADQWVPPAVVLIRADDAFGAADVKGYGRRAHIDEPVFYRMEDEVRSILLPYQVRAWTLGALATLALVLLAVGVYGGVRMWMLTRTKELAVRVALGASPEMLLWELGRRLVPAMGLAIAMGLALGYGAGKVSQGIFVGLSSFDWPSAAIAAVVGVIVSTLAAVGPLRLVIWSPPARALRDG